MAEHRKTFSVRAMCRCLRIQPSGYYAWVKSPFSRRTREDARQNELLKEAWVESGKVYGHRKLHDDLLEQGESACLNRVARLVDAKQTDDRCGSSSLAHGHMAQKAGGKSSDPFGPRQPFHQHGLGGAPPGPQSGALDEPPRRAKQNAVTHRLRAAAEIEA